MKIHQIDLPSEWDYAYLLAISDLHIGEKDFREDKLKRYLDWALNEGQTRIVLVGDIMNTATKDSVSDVYEEVMSPQKQLDYACDLFAPYAKICIGSTAGNHERRIKKSTSIDVSKIFAEKLNIPYEPNGILLKVRVGATPHNGKPHVYSLYATHGFGGGKKVGSKANNLQSLSDSILADIYVMAHVHQMATFQDIYLVPDLRNNKITQVKRTYVTSGSFVEWGGYAQRDGFRPSKTGAPRIRLEGRTKKDVHVSI